MWQARQISLILLFICISLSGCGLAFIFLKQPMTSVDALEQLYLLMEKQRNRGQDGAGVSVIIPQYSYLDVQKITSCKPHALEVIHHSFDTLLQQDYCRNTILMGHVRYGTYAGQGEDFCQPYVHADAQQKNSLVFAGNFNCTNIPELENFLFTQGVERAPKSDTGVVAQLFSILWEKEKNLQNALIKFTSMVDGGYIFTCALADGRSFIYRDPHGIRSAFYFQNEHIIAAASERAALATVFATSFSNIHEIPAGHALIINPTGTHEIEQIASAPNVTPCSFERIYFSRAHDPAIMKERKALGKNIAARVLAQIEYDLEHTIFTYVPNSSELAFVGMIEELEHLTQRSLRVEKILYKDQLLRTFIAHDTLRPSLTKSAYDVVQDVVSPRDTLVIVDDSIVRGTTMKNLLARLISLRPKKIVLVSSAPPVLYPDCYGIDMCKIGTFIAFEASIQLLRERQKNECIERVKNNCLSNKTALNVLTELYEFSLDLLEEKVAQLLKPASWSGELKVVYQTVEGLHKAIPLHQGDWYFTGNYPTTGGYAVAQKSFLNWYFSLDERPY